MSRTPLTMADIRTKRWRKTENGRLLPLSSDAWRKLRKQVLNEEPLCRHCAAQGLTVPATEVDHMRGAADNSREALQALCKSCHSRKTAAEWNGREARMGCDAEGNPINPMHHWNKATVGPARRPAEDVLWKSPATDGDKPACPIHFNADCPEYA